MYFSIIPLVIIIILLGIWVWKQRSWKISVGYLVSGEATPEGYRENEYQKTRYFRHKDGIIDLKKHPEFLKFMVSGGGEVLVEPWTREGDLYLEEGITKLAIFEILDTDYGIIAIPCLRLLETIIDEEVDDPLVGYHKTALGVSWGDKKYHRILPGENLIGIVRYESIQD